MNLHEYQAKELLKKSGYAFETFSSFYFPDGDYQNLNDSIQPVNTFRIILNKFFGSNYPMLGDSMIYVTTESELIKKGDLPK